MATFAFAAMRGGLRWPPRARSQATRQIGAASRAIDDETSARSVELPDVLRGLVSVVPDDDPAAGHELGVIGMSAYVAAMRDLYRRSTTQALADMPCELASGPDPVLAALARATDLDKLAAGIFARDFQPVLTAHFEAGELIFAGRSVNH
jgi:hypothetical protein